MENMQQSLNPLLKLRFPNVNLKMEYNQVLCLFLPKNITVNRLSLCLLKLPFVLAGCLLTDQERYSSTKISGNCEFVMKLNLAA